MTREPDLPPQLLGRPFAVTEARHLGVTHSTLRRKVFDAPFYGARRVADVPPTLRSRCEAAARVLPPSAVFSHETAASLLELPTPRGAHTKDPSIIDGDPVVEVTVQPQQAQPRGRGIQGHRSALLPHEVVDLDGLRVTSPARTWCDLAGRRSLDELVVLGDAVVADAGESGPDGGRLWSAWSSRPNRRTLPVTRPDELRAAATAWGVRRGGRLLRQAGDLVRAGVDSPPETDLRLLVVRAGLPEPMVNLDVHDEDGIWIHRPDLSWPRWRVGVDYDGAHHFTGSQDRLRRDSARREDLRSIGWLLSVVTANDLYGRPGILLGRLRQALLYHGATW